MDLAILVLITFFVGAIIKYTDDLEDERRNAKRRQYAVPLSIVWGLLLGFLISTAPYSMILVASVFAMVIMRKVDTVSHVIGVLVAITTSVLMGLPPISITPFVVFVLFASIDEWDDFIFFNKPDWIVEFRPFLEVGAILIGIFTNEWIYLIGIISFDLGYISSKLIQSKGGK